MQAKNPSRISKVMSRAGIASRREAERMIENGEIILDGHIVEEPYALFPEGGSLRVNGKHVDLRSATGPQRLWAFHKPDGFLVTRDDPGNRLTIFNILPDSFAQLKTIGRLDFHSEGLLLLTNDGELARTYEHPENEYRRVYRVRAYGMVNPERLIRLRKGLRVGDERFGPIEARLEQKRPLTYPKHAWYRVVLREGKYREVRRLFSHLGLTVRRLIRVAYGPYSLGDIPPGRWRVLK